VRDKCIGSNEKGYLDFQRAAAEKFRRLYSVFDLLFIAQLI